jgi:hypothetical protein
MRHLAAVALATALVLTACSDSDTDDSAADEPATSSPTAPESPTPSADDSEPPSEPAASAPEKVALKEAFTDDELGHSIKVTGLVRDFPVPDDFESLRETGELVLIEVDVTAGSEYSGGIKGGFKITSADGTVNAETSIADDAMDAAGFTPFEGVDRAESGTGWFSFQVNTKADTYTLVYERPAATVIGEDKVIPAKTWEFQLP